MTVPYTNDIPGPTYNSFPWQPINAPQVNPFDPSEQRKAIPLTPPHGPCPHCGHCRCCGRPAEAKPWPWDAPPQVEITWHSGHPSVDWQRLYTTGCAAGGGLIEGSTTVVSTIGCRGF